LDTTDLVDDDPLARTDIHLKLFDTFNWQESAKAVFVQTFEELFDVFMSTIGMDIGNSLNGFVALFKNAGQCMKRSHPRPKTNKRNTTNKQPEWWDEVCTKAKYDKYHNLRRYRRTNSKHDLDIYLTSKNVFKNLCRAKYCLLRGNGEIC